VGGRLDALEDLAGVAHLPALDGPGERLLDPFAGGTQRPVVDVPDDNRQQATATDSAMPEPMNPRQPQPTLSIEVGVAASACPNRRSGCVVLA
jgi:hypothetical protein